MNVKASSYKRSIHSIGLAREEEAIIWDFYVTKSVAGSASQKRNVSDYGLKLLPYKEMIIKAGIKEERVKILLANSINETLKLFDLYSGKIGTPDEIEIDIDEFRIVCLTPFSISDENPPKANFSNAESLLTHICSFTVSEIRKEPEKYEELLTQLNDDRFVLKKQYHIVQNFMKDLVAKQKTEDNSLLDLL